MNTIKVKTDQLGDDKEMKTGKDNGRSTEVQAMF